MHNEFFAGSVDNDDGRRANNVSVESGDSQFAGLNNSFGSAGTGLGVGTWHGTFYSAEWMFNGSRRGRWWLLFGVTDELFDKWGDSGVVADNNQHNGDSADSDGRHQAYVQQLENCNPRLSQLQQELQSAQKQVILRVSRDQGHSSLGNGDLAFDMGYARWLDEHRRLTYGLRSAVNAHAGDTELRLLVDGMMSHYEELLMLMRIGAKREVLHILSGMWKTPAERCFMWLGGFRSSDLLKIIGQQIKPLIELQFADICNLQQCCQEAEDALSQGMKALQHSVAGTLFSHDSLDPCTSAKIADYMGQMSIAMTKLVSLEDFLHQADLLRQQTLQQLLRILTIRQAAHALIVISDYKSKFRALNSLWLARRKE
ncbi:transcription factor HBP-1b(c38)-like [Primulina huaijiensis]|uniref:transcription factor HBP-1b(c38)-like n=1 Tax=Primulina huaijiensis TaxID=1492673 RepID=UPI003CC7598E